MKNKILTLLTLFILLFWINNITFANTNTSKLYCSNQLEQYSSGKIILKIKNKIDKILPWILKKTSITKIINVNDKILKIALTSKKLQNNKIKYPIYLYLITQLDKLVDVNKISIKHIANECVLVKQLGLYNSNIDNSNKDQLKKEEVKEEVSNTNNEWDLRYDTVQNGNFKINFNKEIYKNIEITWWAPKSENITDNLITDKNLVKYNYVPQGKIYVPNEYKWYIIKWFGCNATDKEVKKVYGKYFNRNNFYRNKDWELCPKYNMKVIIHPSVLVDKNKIIVWYEDPYINELNKRINNSKLFRKFITWDKIKDSDIKIINWVKMIKNSQWKYYPIDYKSLSYKPLNLNYVDFALDYSTNGVYRSKFAKMDIKLQLWYSKAMKLIDYATMLKLEKEWYYRKSNSKWWEKYEVKSKDVVHDKYLFWRRINYWDGLVLLPIWASRPISYEVWLSNMEYKRLATLENEYNTMLKEYDKIKENYINRKSFKNAINPMDIINAQNSYETTKSAMDNYWKKILVFLKTKYLPLLKQKWTRKNICTYNKLNWGVIEDKTTHKILTFRNYKEYDDFIKDYELLKRYWEEKELLCNN